MNKFDIKAHMDCIHSQFPPSERRPVIGITGNYAELTCRLGEGYYKQVIAAGGVPMVIPPSADKAVLINTLNSIDGLLLSGGADINPLYQGEEPDARLGGINSERDLPELLLTQLAYNRQLPILGICRGIQTLATALGGKVIQDLVSASSANGGNTVIKHSQDADRSEPTHSVHLDAKSTLFNIYKESVIHVNSFHHQAVGDAGKSLRVTAQAADGVIEAVESTEFKPIIGVQWHPECMGDDGLPLFQWLVKEAALFREVKRLHHHTLTLDTHCDTPMFFPQGIHFEQRDERILVDLHKMSEGRLDASIMVAYLPQKSDEWTGQQGEKKAFADRIFDKIGDIVSHNSQYLALARTPADLLANKQAGRKSIMLGIENGLALEDNLHNIEHFARRGVVYITLCHNGDNAICDSARGDSTHGGVSPYGHEVIAEMNRLGLMVDLSHAHERSFYDALDLSATPIVCSHSSARALCDHPRNLTDDQMRALAKKGGVCQITLYGGFLNANPSEATIVDAMRHLDHAIEVMGIEHVGLGTDFDGDGGIRGLASASELPNFTRELLKRRYSEADIRLIWGGNFLRVMQQVQSSRQ